MQYPPQNNQGYQQGYQPPYQPVGPPPKDPSTGLLLELLGLVGFSGIGWLWAGETAIGIALLLGFWVFLAIEAVLMFVVIGFCLLPLNLIIPVASGLLLQKRLKERLPRPVEPQYPPQQQYPF